MTVADMEFAGLLIRQLENPGMYPPYSEYEGFYLLTYTRQRGQGVLMPGNSSTKVFLFYQTPYIPRQ
jgi:hypothetical protein